MMTNDRPALPFTRLPRSYPRELRVVFAGLVDQYVDLRLHQDPRDIVATMLSTVRGITKYRPKHEHRLLALMRQLNTPSAHGFHCPDCFETRFEKLEISLIRTQHGIALVASRDQVGVHPLNCLHQRIETTCHTCRRTWQPPHRFVVGHGFAAEAIDPHPGTPNSELN